ncbi:unnamed protein product [Paramecium primaurelia]|uniref:WD domain, G-beta repeat protein n=1 Tax=Paramecium primaurelia TaxID=5886 RepID=A0A8S1KDV7_PARPR|nr:unnamed protein product [Paramecium primaurelia]
MIFKCSNPNHDLDTEFVCMNETCQESRIFCFKCLQNEKHKSHVKEIHKIENFENLLCNQIDNLTNELEQKINLISTLFIKFKSAIQVKSQINIKQLNGLNITEISQFIQDQIRIQNESKAMFQLLYRSTENVVQTLKMYINELFYSDHPIKKVKKESITGYRIIHSFEEDQINAIEFISQSNLMIVGYESRKINIYQFNKGQIKQLQKLKIHKKSVYSLITMKRTNEFFSGSCDKTIILWEQFDDNQWHPKQVLTGHLGGISCLVLNKSEDLLLSGSDDFTIKSWKKDKEFWICSQTLTGHHHYVCSISLNENENHFISCSKDKQIFIFSFDDQKQLWKQCQTILTRDGGRRLCFINNSEFVFQPERKKKLQIFSKNDYDSNFIKNKEISIYTGTNINSNKTCFWFFPQQYIKSQSILVNKSSCSINLIRLNENDDYEIIQHIDFQTNRVIGRMTENGEYLVTWDDKTKNLQIRQQRDC